MKSGVSLAGLLGAALRMALGLVLGAGLLEAILRANPTLLLHGMALPAPADPRVEVQEYQVHLSDADVFYWIPGRIRPVPPEADRLEATVRFETDELGFPNPAPLPDVVDVVVLGRSFSLGAQATSPWARLLAEDTGWRVLNLSEAGSGIETKLSYARRFGLPRRPRWVIVEILPSMDIIGHNQAPATIVGGLPFAFIQEAARQVSPPSRMDASDAVYPIDVSIPGNPRPLVFFDYYVAALSVGATDIRESRQWRAFGDGLQELQRAIEDSGACMAILYAPTNAEIYFPLATDPSQLAPVVDAVSPWRLNSAGVLAQIPEAVCDVECMRLNASGARSAVAALAAERGTAFMDPSDRMTAAVMAGQNPFMAYDTHWSALGHQIVADLVVEVLGQEACP